MVLIDHYFDMLNVSANFCTYIYAFSKSLTFLLFENVFCFGCSAVSHTHIYNSFSHTSFTGSVNLKQNITPNVEAKEKLELEILFVSSLVSVRED